MRYIVHKSVIRVVGKLWMPSVNAAQTIELTKFDVDNARDDEGKITRESVQNWLDTHAGDFSSTIDFEASIEDGDNTVDIPFSTEEGEISFHDCYPEF